MGANYSQSDLGKETLSRKNSFLIQLVIFRVSNVKFLNRFLKVQLFLNVFKIVRVSRKSRNFHRVANFNLIFLNTVMLLREIFYLPRSVWLLYLIDHTSYWHIKFLCGLGLPFIYLTWASELYFVLFYRFLSTVIILIAWDTTQWRSFGQENWLSFFGWNSRNFIKYRELGNDQGRNRDWDFESRSSHRRDTSSGPGHALHLLHGLHVLPGNELGWQELVIIIIVPLVCDGAFSRHFCQFWGVYNIATFVLNKMIFCLVKNRNVDLLVAQVAQFNSFS